MLGILEKTVIFSQLEGNNRKKCLYSYGDWYLVDDDISDCIDVHVFYPLNHT